jgi:hypothetical protein
MVAPIKFRKRRRALFINIHAHAHGFRPVILPLKERRSAVVTNTLHFRRTRIDMVHRFASGAGPAATQPRNDFSQWQIVAQHGFEPDVMLGEAFFQRFRLRDCARETVQQKPAAAAKAVASLDEQFQHRFIRHQVAAAHVFQGAGHGLGAFAFAQDPGRAKNVAGGKVASSQSRRKQLSLGAFSNAGRAEQHEPMRMGLALRLSLALGFTALEPCVAVGVFLSDGHWFGKLGRVSESLAAHRRGALARALFQLIGIAVKGTTRGLLFFEHFLANLMRAQKRPAKLPARLKVFVRDSGLLLRRAPSTFLVFTGTAHGGRHVLGDGADG